MEILINELSLTGQFGSVGDFIGRGLDPFLSVISEVNSSANMILKKRNFWQSQVTRSDTIHDIFIGKISRTNDAIRKSKSLLAARIDEPFWEDSQKHSASDCYEYNIINIAGSIAGSSLAESCERDNVIISFIHNDFSTTKLKVIKNNSQNLEIDNLFDKSHYIEVAYSRGQIDKREYFKRKFTFGLITLLENEYRFTRTSKVEQGQQVYKETSTNRYWYLDKFHKTHYEVFNSVGKHIGEANLDGIIDESKKDNTKTITL
jgi:hypothetical protein